MPFWTVCPHRATAQAQTWVHALFLKLTSVFEQGLDFHVVLGSVGMEPDLCLGICRVACCEKQTLW